MKKLVFIFVLALGFAGKCHAQSWTFIQDSPAIFCIPGTSCTIGTGNITPTVAGSVWIVQVQTPSNVTISSVTGGGGTWTHCPNCHVFNPAGYSTDVSYSLSGNAGVSSGITVNLSGNSGAFLSLNFIELLPPSGSTASYDDSNVGTGTSCTTCTAPTLTHITGTDAIWRNDGGSAPAAFNSWSAPYITDANGMAVGLNVTSGTGPTVTYNRVSNPEYVGIAFTSTAGHFTPPTPQYSVVNYTAPQTAVKNGNPTACFPSCTLTIPSTSAGNLLYLEAANASGIHINSVSCASCSAWSVPVACQANHVITIQNDTISCAYNLAVPAGVTSLNITMSGNANEAFAATEVAATNGGSFMLDAIGSNVYTGTSFFPAGQPLTLTGKNDVIFQTLFCEGGSLGPNYYPQPYNVSSFNYFYFNLASIAVLTDSGPSPATPTWLNPQHDAVVGSGVAFKTSGTGTRPAPPTGLGAVVN